MNIRDHSILALTFISGIAKRPLDDLRRLSLTIHMNAYYVFLIILKITMFQISDLLMKLSIVIF